MHGMLWESGIFPSIFGLSLGESPLPLCFQKKKGLVLPPIHGKSHGKSMGPQWKEEKNHILANLASILLKKWTVDNY